MEHKKLKVTHVSEIVDIPETGYNLILTKWKGKRINHVQIEQYLRHLGYDQYINQII
jgi:hypothetical protein